jgi:hypothetical protein
MDGKCRLCGKQRVLLESHIVPSFVYKWLKESSGTGYMRFGQEPNRRAQDGYKRYWLCSDCEQRLGTFESTFARQVFHPMSSGEKSSVVYGPWLRKFCVSVSWRVLSFFLEEDAMDHFSSKMKRSSYEAVECWRQYLMELNPHPAKYKQHFLPMETIQDYSNGDLPANINRYILRAIDIDAVCTPESAFVYSKLCRFVIIGFIEMPHPQQWEGTKVGRKHGKIKPRHYVLPFQFGEYLKNRARNLEKLNDAISEKQKKKIENTYRENIDRAVNSESFEAMHHDVTLFGDRAFKKE